MRIANDLERRLRAHVAFDAAEQAHLDHLLGFLASGGDPVARANPVGHVTASALVIDRETSTTLLTHHARLGKWFQLGGHVDPGDETVLGAALREATEESGLVGLTPWDDAVFDVDVHPFPFIGAGTSPSTCISTCGSCFSRPTGTSRSARSPTICAGSTWTRRRWSPAMTRSDE